MRKELEKNSKYRPTILHGRFQDMHIKDESIDHIITDPPYAKKYIGEWQDLAILGHRVLKPSGFLITYSGHNIPDIARIFNGWLDYYHMLTLIHKGSHAGIIHVRMWADYKPIWIFQKPPYKPLSKFMSNVLQGTGREKDYHEWQQAVDELTPLIENFTREDELILDPFAGSGTTGIACMNLNRYSLLIEAENA